jgi:hypothetical protein
MLRDAGIGRRQLTAVALVAAVAGGIAGAGLPLVGEAWAQQSRTLRTQRLEIVDAAGDMRAFVGMNRDGKPMVALYSDKQKVKFMLVLGDNDIPILVMNGKAGHDIIGMSVNDDDTAAINWSDRANKVRGALTIEKDGNFKIEASDAQERTLKSWP